MTTSTHGTHSQKLEDKPGFLNVPRWRHGRVRILADEISLDRQRSGSKIRIGTLPARASVLLVFATSSASLGSARISIGQENEAQSHGRSRTVTSTTEPVWFSPEPETETLDGETPIFVHVSTTSLPATGTLTVNLLYVVD